MTTSALYASEPAWSYRQVRDFSRNIRKRLGEAWTWMTPDMRAAIIAAEALRIGGLQHERVTVADVEHLRDRIMREMGVEA